MDKVGYRRSITKQLIIYIVLFSSLITLMITIFQLYREYTGGVDQVKGQLHQIKTLSLPGLVENVWNLYDKQVQIQLEDLVQLPDLRYLEIRSKGKVVASAGIVVSKNSISQTIPMIYTREDEMIPIGELFVVATLEGVYKKLIDKTLIILISNAIKTFLVSIFIFFIFQFLVIRHLVRISRHLQRLTPDRFEELLTLKRKPNKDELQLMAATINEMGVNLSKTTVSKKYVDNIITSMADTLIVVNPDETIRTVNQATLDLLGYEEKELIGKAIGSIFEEEQRLFQGSGLETLVKEGNVQSLEMTYLSKSREKIPVLFSGSVMRDEEGKIQGIVCVTSEITERKKAEEALQEMNIALKVLLKKRDHDKVEIEEQVLANFKELVKPYLERLKRSRLDEKQKIYVNILESNINDIVSPFVRSVSIKYQGFTPTELQVASLVKQGKTTKEIAEIMNLSSTTINTHRKNIRKKSGIENKKVNLRTFLSSFPG